MEAKFGSDNNNIAGARQQQQQQPPPTGNDVTPATHQSQSYQAGHVFANPKKFDSSRPTPIPSTSNNASLLTSVARVPTPGQARPPSLSSSSSSSFSQQQQQQQMHPDEKSFALGIHNNNNNLQRPSFSNFMTTALSPIYPVHPGLPGVVGVGGVGVGGVNAMRGSAMRDNNNNLQLPQQLPPLPSSSNNNMRVPRKVTPLEDYQQVLSSRGSNNVSSMVYPSQPQSNLPLIPGGGVGVPGGPGGAAGMGSIGQKTLHPGFAPVGYNYPPSVALQQQQNHYQSFQPQTQTTGFGYANDFAGNQNNAFRFSPHTQPNTDTHSVASSYSADEEEERNHHRHRGRKRRRHASHRSRSRTRSRSGSRSGDHRSGTDNDSGGEEEKRKRHYNTRREQGEEEREKDNDDQRGGGNKKQVEEEKFDAAQDYDRKRVNKYIQKWKDNHEEEEEEEKEKKEQSKEIDPKAEAINMEEEDLAIEKMSRVEIDLALISAVEDGKMKFRKGFNIKTASKFNKQLELNRLNHIKGVRRFVQRWERHMMRIFTVITTFCIALGLDKEEMNGFKSDMSDAIEDGEFREDLKQLYTRMGAGPVGRRSISQLIYTPLISFVTALLVSLIPVVISKIMENKLANESKDSNKNNSKSSAEQHGGVVGYDGRNPYIQMNGYGQYAGNYGNYYGHPQQPQHQQQQQFSYPPPSQGYSNGPPQGQCYNYPYPQQPPQQTPQQNPAPSVYPNGGYPHYFNYNAAQTHNNPSQQQHIQPNTEQAVTQHAQPAANTHQQPQIQQQHASNCPAHPHHHHQQHVHHPQQTPQTQPSQTQTQQQQNSALPISATPTIPVQMSVVDTSADLQTQMKQIMPGTLSNPAPPLSNQILPAHMEQPYASTPASSAPWMKGATQFQNVITSHANPPPWYPAHPNQNMLPRHIQAQGPSAPAAIPTMDPVGAGMDQVMSKIQPLFETMFRMSTSDGAEDLTKNQKKANEKFAKDLRHYGRVDGDDDKKTASKPVDDSKNNTGINRKVKQIRGTKPTTITTTTIRKSPVELKKTIRTRSPKTEQLEKKAASPKIVEIE